MSGGAVGIWPDKAVELVHNLCSPDYNNSNLDELKQGFCGDIIILNLLRETSEL